MGEWGSPRQGQPIKAVALYHGELWGSLELPPHPRQKESLAQLRHASLLVILWLVTPGPIKAEPLLRSGMVWEQACGRGEAQGGPLGPTNQRPQPWTHRSGRNWHAALIHGSDALILDPALVLPFAVLGPRG